MEFLDRIHRKIKDNLEHLEARYGVEIQIKEKTRKISPKEDYLAVWVTNEVGKTLVIIKGKNPDDEFNYLKEQCNELFKKRLKRRKEIKERLSKVDPSIFPDAKDLFGPKK